MTDCEDCRRWEAPPPTRASIARDMLLAGLSKLPLLRPSPVSQMISHMGMAMAVMYGSALSEPTWYEKHRQAWIETGDLAELDRMLRHPLPPLPAYKLPRARSTHDRGNWRLPALTSLAGLLIGAGLAVVLWQVLLIGWLW